MTATPAARRNNFDFLRLLAATTVLVHHAVIHLDTNFLWHNEGNNWWFNGGVPLFFILSGMMVYRSGEKCRENGLPWRSFYANRALRIMPAIYVYIVVITIFFVATGAVAPAEVATPTYGAYVASNLLLAPVYTPPALSDYGVGVINGSLPTIPMEVSFYVIVPLLVMLIARLRWTVALALVFVVAAAGIVLYASVGGTEAQPMVWKVYGVTFLPYLWYFALGMFWTRAWPKVIQSGWIALAAIVLYFVIDKIPVGADGSVITRAVAAIPLSYAAMWFGYKGPRFFSTITSRLGDLSFGTYIWHMIVVNALVFYGARNWPIDGTLLVLVVFVISIAIAFLSWRFVERPALSRKPYSSRSKPVDGTAVDAPSTAAEARA
ncbi:acyltransferase family protein [Microbacterium stercoris]|uniref:Acyltransferase n=1 Tax=Microbacterium stercoris TaxID=2820289 RepID=A0A939QQB3_9MICO|nr:acyltransferase [Microbacterium stercoris]MBO3663531.1 acyltransferase [Microbacterium stercoris]